MKQQQPPEEPELAPPANLDAERYVLAACLNNPKSLEECLDSLSSEDFSLEKHRRIFDRMRDLKEMGFSVDRVTLAEGLMARGQLESVDGLSYIVSLDEGMPAVSHVADYIRIVKEKSDLRKLIHLAQNILNRASLQEEAPKEILDSLERRIYTNFPVITSSKALPLSAYIDSKTIDNLLDPSRTRGAGIFTGYTVLDDMTGGIFPEENWIFGAAPSVGKSAIALQIALHNAKRKVPVLMYSMEMGKTAIFNRLVCQLAGVSVRRFRTGELSQRERGKAIEATALLRELPLHIDDSHKLKPSDVRRRTLRAMDEYGIQLQIDDFIQKMRPDVSKGSENDRLTEICDEWVGIAKDACPCVHFSQLTREYKKMKGKPSISDLRGSGSLEQMGNVIVLPYREEMEPGKGADPQLRGKAEFLLAKNREGELATIPMRFIGWRMLFHDPDDDRYRAHPEPQTKLSDDF